MGRDGLSYRYRLQCWCTLMNARRAAAAGAGRHQPRERRSARAGVKARAPEEHDTPSTARQYVRGTDRLIARKRRHLR